MAAHTFDSFLQRVFDSPDLMLAKRLNDGHQSYLDTILGVTAAREQREEETDDLIVGVASGSLGGRMKHCGQRKERLALRLSGEQDGLGKPVIMTLYHDFATKAAIAHHNVFHGLEEDEVNIENMDVDGSLSFGRNSHSYSTVDHHVATSVTTTAAAATAGTGIRQTSVLRKVEVLPQLGLDCRVGQVVFVSANEDAYVACRAGDIVDLSEEVDEYDGVGRGECDDGRCCCYVRPVHSTRNDDTATPLGVLAAHVNCVTNLAVSHDFTLIATCSADTTVSIMEMLNYRCVSTLPHPAKPRCAAFTPDALYLVTGDEDHRCRVWSTRCCTQAASATAVYARHKHPITCVAVSPCPGFTASTATGNHNAPGNNSVAAAGRGSNGNNGCSCCYMVASGDEAGAVHVWDALSESRLFALARDGAATPVLSLCFHKHGRVLLSATGQRVVLTDVVVGGATLQVLVPTALPGLAPPPRRRGSSADLMSGEAGFGENPNAGQRAIDHDSLLADRLSFVAASFGPTGLAQDVLVCAVSDGTVVLLEMSIAPAVSTLGLRGAGGGEAGNGVTTATAVPATTAATSVTTGSNEAGESHAVVTLVGDPPLSPNCHSLTSAHKTASGFKKGGKGMGRVMVSLASESWSTRLRGSACCVAAGSLCSVIIGDELGNVVVVRLEPMLMIAPPMHAGVENAHLGSSTGHPQRPDLPFTGHH